MGVISLTLLKGGRYDGLLVSLLIPDSKPMVAIGRRPLYRPDPSQTLPSYWGAGV
jgi:hypothetical protein